MQETFFYISYILETRRFRQQHRSNLFTQGIPGRTNDNLKLHTLYNIRFNLVCIKVYFFILTVLTAYLLGYFFFFLYLRYLWAYVSLLNTKYMYLVFVPISDHILTICLEQKLV